MTKEELLRLLEECRTRIASGTRPPEVHWTGDPAQAHIDADMALLAYINDEQVTAAWHAIIPKWFE